MDRMQVEMEVIVPKGFADYFLIVWDFINYARQNGIPVGPGRGSAAGSLVAYLLGITNINPLEHTTFFSNASLTRNAPSCPTWTPTSAWSGAARSSSIAQQVRRRQSAQIITFGRMKARAAIRDVGRVLDMPLAKVDKIAKTVPEGPNVSSRMPWIVGIQAKMVDEDPETRQLVKWPCASRAWPATPAFTPLVWSWLATAWPPSFPSSP
jgi:DNA polymerase-3 subunit alpha